MDGRGEAYVPIPLPLELLVVDGFEAGVGEGVLAMFSSLGAFPASLTVDVDVEREFEPISGAK